VKCSCKVYETIAKSVGVRYHSWSVEIINKQLIEIQCEIISLAPGFAHFPITFLQQPLPFNFSLFYAKTLNRYEFNFSEITLSNMQLPSVYVPKKYVLLQCNLHTQTDSGKPPPVTMLISQTSA